MPNLNTKIAEELISHLHDIVAFTNGEIKELVSILNKAHEQTLEEVAKLEAKGITEARVQRVNKAILEAYNEAKVVYQNELYDSSFGLMKNEVAIGSNLLTESIPVKLDLLKPSASLLKRLVKDTPISIGKNQTITAPSFLESLFGIGSESVVNEVKYGIINGRTPSQIVRKLKGTAINNGKDGDLFNLFNKKTESFVRTANISYTNEARQSLYQENADIIKGEKVDATLDTRTCQICANYDNKVTLWNKQGEIYQDGLNGARPPFHYNCRCVLVPITRSWKDLGLDKDDLPELTRSSMDGEVPQDTTYADWFDKQPRKRQIEILGESRYELYKNGLPINKFANNGKTFTLKELEARGKK